MDRMTDLLSAREERVLLQEELLRVYGGVLLVHRVNMPGPEKGGPLALALFETMEAVLEETFGPETLASHKLLTAEGPTALRLVSGDADGLKGRAVALENTHPLGRFADLDVHIRGEGSLSRTKLGHEPRRCYLCGEPAHGCAREQRHPYEALVHHMEKALKSYETGL